MNRLIKFINYYWYELMFKAYIKKRPNVMNFRHETYCIDTFITKEAAEEECLNTPNQ